MNWMEAVKMMKEGKKVRRPTFNEGNYLYFGNHILMSGINKERAYLCDGHFGATDWEVVEIKRALSDKVITIENPNYPYVYKEQDVQKALSNFIENYLAIYLGDSMRSKAKEIFGERLI